MNISLFAYFTDLVNETGIENAAERVRECGYTGVEFFYTEASVPNVEKANEYREALAKYKLTVPCVSCYADVIKQLANGEPDRSAIDALKRLADFTSALGAKYLHHTVYPRLDKTNALAYADVIDSALKGCAEVAEYAKAVGVTVIYEPQGLVFNGKAGFTDFYLRLKAMTDNVAVCFDVGNPYWVGEEPFELLEAIKTDVAHVHLKDYKDAPSDTEGYCPTEVPIGNGAIDINRIAKTFREINYDGFFSVEDATNTPIEEKCKLAKTKLI